ncbi:MAG TPA: GNAT family N-acetyltransferase [Acidimicrobiia bacterium]
MEPAPELRTERLLLRRWRPEDRAPFAALNADPRVMEHFPSILTRAESDGLVDRIEAGFEQHGFGLWAVEVPGLAPFVGFIGLAAQGAEFPFGPTVEVGWRLAHRYWGVGYATEGARAALECGLDGFGLDEIVSFTAAINLRSQRVMRRLGMTHHARDDFDHPRLPFGHPLRRHVLYRTAGRLLPVDTQQATVSTTGTNPVVVTAVGEFDFESSDRLRSALMTAAQDCEGDVIVDLSRTEFLDSIAIGVLLQTWQRLRSLDREMVIRSPHARIRRVLEIASIGEVVRVEHADA